jgi:hypothetical protein
VSGKPIVDRAAEEVMTARRIRRIARRVGFLAGQPGVRKTRRFIV